MLSESVRPAIVFTTAHAEHAVDAFALDGSMSDSSNSTSNSSAGDHEKPPVAESRPAWLETSRRLKCQRPMPS